MVQVFEIGKKEKGTEESTSSVEDKNEGHNVLTINPYMNQDK